MTRLEELAKQRANAKAKLDAQKLLAAQKEAAYRAESRKARHKLQATWGKILDDLGLLDVPEPFLREVLAVAYRLVRHDLVQWKEETLDPHEDAYADAVDLERLIAKRVPFVLYRGEEHPSLAAVPDDAEDEA